MGGHDQPRWISKPPVDPLRPCPFCHKDVAKLNDTPDGFLVTCADCKASGPSFRDEHQAAQAWNGDNPIGITWQQEAMARAGLKVLDSRGAKAWAELRRPRFDREQRINELYALRCSNEHTEAHAVELKSLQHEEAKSIGSAIERKRNLKPEEVAELDATIVALENLHPKKEQS